MASRAKTPRSGNDADRAMMWLQGKENQEVFFFFLNNFGV